MCLRYFQASGSPEAAVVAKKAQLLMGWDIGGWAVASYCSVIVHDKGIYENIPGAVHTAGGHSSD